MYWPVFLFGWYFLFVCFLCVNGNFMRRILGRESFALQFRDSLFTSSKLSTGVSLKGIWKNEPMVSQVAGGMLGPILSRELPSRDRPLKTVGFPSGITSPYIFTISINSLGFKHLREFGKSNPAYS